MRIVVSGLLLLLVVSLAPSLPARACDRLPLFAVNTPSFPADGALEVPLDARPLVNARGADGFLAAEREDVALQQGPDFVPVDVDVDALFVRGEYGRSERVIRLTPRAPLLPVTLYRLVDADGRIAEFTTGAADAAAPELSPPVVAVTTVQPDRPDRTGFSCGFSGRATLVVTTGDGNDGVPLLGVVGLGAAPDVVAAEDEATPLAGLGAPSLDIFGDGPLDLEVAMIDAAGRVSPTTAVSVDLSDDGGCAQARGGEVGVVGLALLLVRRRRRRA